MNMCGDTCGGEKTYEEQICMPLDGKVVCIDRCIHQIVASLNAGGVRTTACCCGHGKIHGRIELEDGRVLAILNADEMKIIEMIDKKLNK
jgi:hypothetical protein